MECTPAPRYKGGANPFPDIQKKEKPKKGKKKSKLKKTLSYNPNTTVYKGISSF